MLKALAIAALMAPCLAGAATVTMDLSGPCGLDCGAFGLDKGDPVTAWLSIDDASYTPGGESTYVVDNFLVDLGDTFWTPDNVAGAYSVVRWGPAPDLIDAISFHFGENIMTPGIFVGLSNSVQDGFAGFAYDNGFCIDAACLTGKILPGHTAGFGNYDPDPIPPVPLPPALPMLVAGIGALGWLSRARRRRSTAPSAQPQPL